MAQVSSVVKFARAFEAVASSHPNYSVWLDGQSLEAGPYPTAALWFDFAGEKIVGESPTPPKEPEIALDTVVGRFTGDVWLTLFGQTRRYPSKKALLFGALKAIEETRPGTLLKLEAHKPRTKRVVARKPERLYEDQALVKKFSAELMPGWYVATNNSTQEVQSYIRKAAELAGLKWGSEIDLRFS